MPEIIKPSGRPFDHADSDAADKLHKDCVMIIMDRDIYFLFPCCAGQQEPILVFWKKGVINLEVMHWPRMCKRMMRPCRACCTAKAAATHVTCSAHCALSTASPVTGTLMPKHVALLTALTFSCLLSTLHLSVQEPDSGNSGHCISCSQQGLQQGLMRSNTWLRPALPAARTSVAGVVQMR